MHKLSNKLNISLLMLIFLLSAVFNFVTLLASDPVEAISPPQHLSPGFGLDEYFIGPGGLNELTSASYSARATLGEIAVGDPSSANSVLYSGFETTDEIFLELVVTGADIDVGVLSTASTATAEAQFYVRSYLAHGYSITSSGLPTSENGTSLNLMSAGGVVSPGTEQFGINLVANPVLGVGSNPVQVPDSNFSYGQIAAGYGTAESFRYNEGEQIAFSDKSSGRTDFTISYIFDTSLATEAGRYVLVHSIIATASF